MGKTYREEMRQLPATMEWAAEQKIELLRRAVQLHGDRGLLAIGSGGSFTAAAFAAAMHLHVYGRPSQAITPLECHQLPGSAASLAAGLLLSAEGKNPDILAAAQQLQLRGVPAIGLTLRDSSPLVELCNATGAASLDVHEMPWGKDGYLATNSLLATLIMLWRAYTADDEFQRGFKALQQWYTTFPEQLQAAMQGVAPTSRALILHGVAGRIAAVDLESKLTEGALAFGQLCNFRQFAHGRHLQLDVPADPITIASFSTKNDPLARATLGRIPAQGARIIDIELPALGHAATEIAGVLAAFLLTHEWAGEQRDPGRPDVPPFGRDIHFLDVARLVQEPLPPSPAISRKRAADATAAQVISAGGRYIDRLAAARFKALVCDFDGTFCDTVRRFEGLDVQIGNELTRLARAGLHLAFATGRGAKLAKELRKKLPQDIWPHITLGCYSGSLIFRLDQEPGPSCSEPLLSELSDWLAVTRAKPCAVSPNIDVGQLSLRGVPSSDKVRLMAAINEWVAMKGLTGWRTFCSAHSVDVITANAGKNLVVDAVCEQFNLDPTTQLLRIGDAGDFGGNDYELLACGLALSVDTVPPGWNQCWNLLPRVLSGVRGTEYYLRALSAEAGEARFTDVFLRAAAEAVRDGIGPK